MKTMDMEVDRRGGDAGVMGDFAVVAGAAVRVVRTS